MKVNELKPGQNKIELIIKIEEKTDSREVTSKLDDMFHKVCEALVGDETGSVFLSLWDEKIEEIIPGKHYKITEAYTNEFRNSMRLNLGKYSKIEEIEKDFEINTANNLSLKEISGETLL